MRLLTTAFTLSVLATSVATAATPTKSSLPLDAKYDESTSTLVILGEDGFDVSDFKLVENGYTYTVNTPETKTISTVTQIGNKIRKVAVEEIDASGLKGVGGLDVQLELFEGSNPKTKEDLILMTDYAKFSAEGTLDYSKNDMAIAEIAGVGCEAENKALIKVDGYVDFSKQAKDIGEAWEMAKESDINISFAQKDLSSFSIGLNTDPKQVTLKMEYKPECKTISSEYMKAKDKGMSATFIGMGSGMLAGSAPTLSKGLLDMMPLATNMIHNPSEDASYSFSVPRDTLKSELMAVSEGVAKSLSGTVTIKGASSEPSYDGKMPIESKPE